MAPSHRHYQCHHIIYIHQKLKMEPQKSLEELKSELEEALEIEDYESAIKINKIIHQIHIKNKKKST